MKAPEQTVSIEWADVKQRVLKSVGEGKRWTEQAFGADMAKMAQRVYGKSFYAGGHAPADALQWIREGFFAPEFQTAAAPLQTSLKRRAMWSEEDGEVDVSRMMGGYDDVYFAVEKRERKPGIRIEFDLFFAANVKPKVLTEYGEWMASLVRTLESQGYDLSIAARAPVDQMTTKVKGRTHMLLEVKRTGELSEFREWSSLFSPCGTRTLLFCGFGIAAQKLGQKMTEFCAMSVTDIGWGLEWEPETSTLRITANQRALSFPREGLTAQLTEHQIV